MAWHLQLTVVTSAPSEVYSSKLYQDGKGGDHPPDCVACLRFAFRFSMSVR